MPKSYFASRKLDVSEIYSEVFLITRIAAAQDAVSRSLTVKISRGSRPGDVARDRISSSSSSPFGVFAQSGARSVDRVYTGCMFGGRTPNTDIKCLLLNP